MFKQNAVYCMLTHLVRLFQVDRAPKEHLVEEFEEFDYSDLYDDLSASLPTAGPNVTEYEVRLSSVSFWSLLCLSFPYVHLYVRLLDSS